MKRKLFCLLILAVVFNFTACAKKADSNVLVSSVMERIKKEANFKNASEKDLMDLNVAKRYGISISEIAEGLVYASNDENKADEILLVKAKTDDVLESVERTLDAEVDKLATTWEKTSEEEYDKVKNHILKSNGRYVLLVVAKEPAKIEKIFDEMI